MSQYGKTFCNCFPTISEGFKNILKCWTWCHCLKTNCFSFTKKWFPENAWNPINANQQYLIQHLHPISQTFFYLFPWLSPKVHHYLNLQSNEITMITMSVSPDGDWFSNLPVLASEERLHFDWKAVKVTLRNVVCFDCFVEYVHES